MRRQLALAVDWLRQVLWRCRLVVFFGIYLGIVNNQSLDRSVRFNALQAVLLDIILMYGSPRDVVVCVRLPAALASQHRSAW